MRAGGVLVAVLGVVSACGSSATEGVASCAPQGTYVVSYTRNAANPGDCPFPNGLMPDTTTVLQTTGGASVSFNGIGGSCDGPLDAACELTCKQSFKDGGTVQLAWKFAPGGPTGLITMVIVSSTGSGKTCTASWDVSGSKR